MNNKTRNNLIKKYGFNKTSKKKPMRSLSITNKSSTSTSGKSKYTSRNNTSKSRLVGDTYEMVELKNYALWYYKNNMLEYRRFVDYILYNLDIFCSYSVNKNYIQKYISRYFYNNNNTNIKVYVIINLDKRLKIDIVDQIKAFAIVRDKLVHENNVYGQLMEGKYRKIQGACSGDVNGYNFFYPSDEQNKSRMWAELVAICAITPSIMPKMNINPTLYKPTKFSLLNSNTWTETRRMQRNVKRNNIITVLSKRTQKQKNQILGLERDKFLKGIGSMLLRELHTYYQNINENGKPYSFMYLQATNTKLFDFYFLRGLNCGKILLKHIKLKSRQFERNNTLRYSSK